MKVCKFGGRASTDIRAIKNVILLCKNKERKVIVFSAIGKANCKDEKLTDLIIDYTKNNNDEIKNKIINKFKTLCKKLKIKININYEINKIINNYKITKNAESLISKGEYLTAKLFSIKLNIKFIPAEKIIFINNNKFNFIKIKQKLNYYIKKYGQICIPGFYGINEQKEIVLFNRGGGDLTGGVVAKCLAPCIYENFTDVNGIYEENPKIKRSKLLKTLSYERLIMLTKTCGVIQNDCAVLLNNSTVVLNVRNVYNLKSKGSFVKTY